MSDLQSIQPRPIKVLAQSRSTSELMKKQLRMQKTGKVTAVVVLMHIFGEAKRNYPNAKAKISAKKANIGPKLKKIGLY
jgi:hypothetical protein